MHFTPTGSRWLNPVERWFGLLTELQQVGEKAAAMT
jgi:hypothetical protein